MTKHYDFNLPRFFHSIPEPRVRRYFEGLAKEPPSGWASLNADAFEQWLREPDQQEIEPLVRQQFRRMNDLAAHHANLVGEGFRMFEVAGPVSESAESQAMALFTECPKGFDYAWTRYLVYANAETLTDYYFPASKVDLTGPAVEAFKRKIREYYETNAKGRQCRLEVFSDNGDIFVSIQRGHYLRTVSMFEPDSDDVRYRSFRPAVDDVIVFEPRSKVLRVKATSGAERETYMGLFATLCPRTEHLISVARTTQAYSLEPLQSGAFNFKGEGSVLGVRMIRGKYKLNAKATAEYRAQDVLRIPELRGGPRGLLVSVSLLFAFQEKKGLRWVRSDITPPARGRLPDDYKVEVETYLRNQGVKLL